MNRNNNLADIFAIRGSLTFKFNIFIMQFREQCSKRNMKKAFREIIFVCEDFSLNREENELHRKYKVLGGSTENEMDCSNFRYRTKWMVPLDLARLRVYNSIFLLNYPKINLIKKFEHRVNFFLKKINFMNLFKKNPIE